MPPRTFRSLAAAFAVASAATAPSAAADEVKKQPPAGSREAEEDEQGEIISEVTVEGEKPASNAASEISVGRRELELRPRLRPGDIVEAVPGTFAVQHAGGGKANQYFLRGFDADHGTDIAFFVDGVPVNMPSHGHGQGYSDLHFLIPELVVGLDGYKGTYFADLGDFATAGAIKFKLAEKFDESLAQYSIGQYGVMRGLVIESPDLGDAWRVVTAAELYKDDGPFQNPEDLRRMNLFLRAAHDVDRTDKITATWMSYGSTWNASGQIPARAVCGEGEDGNPPPEAYGESCIDRFGYVDPTEGGSTQRHMASLAYQHLGHDAEFNALAYFIAYRFTLYSNFTFFLDDPIHGDEIEQDDDRSVGGVDFNYKTHVHYRGAKFTTTYGLQARYDGIENAVYHDEARTRLGSKYHDKISESEEALYVEEDARLRPWLRLVLGLRLERADVDVDDLNAEAAAAAMTTPAAPDGSGFKGSMLPLPKAQAILSPIPELDFFLDWGRGFHSNDARGVVLKQNAATLLVPATGWEAGVRVSPVPDLSLSATAFLLDLASELVWNGDEGGTSPSGQTRRYGLELSGRYHISNWLFADADATFVKARYVDNGGDGDAVALAPTRTFTAGIGARPTFGQFTPFADVRVKSIADRPADPAGQFTAQGFTVVDGDAGLRWKRYEVGVDAQNIFDATYREVSFVSTSRLPYEPGPVTGIHYTPGWPRTVIGKATLYW